MKRGHSTKEIWFEETPSFENRPTGLTGAATCQCLTSTQPTPQQGATSSQHRAAQEKCGAPDRSESPYQQRTTQRDNPTQQLIKQAVDFLHPAA